MSLITELLEGKIDPASFVSQAAADLKKDLGIFASPMFLQWALDALAGILQASGKVSPTLVAIIKSEIEKVLNLPGD